MYCKVLKYFITLHRENKRGVIRNNITPIIIKIKVIKNRI